MGMDSEVKKMSVIIPLYNTENYLRQCVESLSNQNTVMEIIIVDDGSTDGSGQIAEEIGQKDKRIKVMHQENRGPSAARNRGIDAAVGEYIFFLDSDDWIKDYSLDYLYAQASNCHADIVMGNAVFYYPDGQKTNPYGNIPEEITGIPLSGRQCFIELMKASAFAPMVYCYICRREYIQSHHFRFEQVIHEDELWTPVILGSSSNVLVTNFDFYFYRQQRENSIINSSKPQKRLHALFYVTDRLVNYANKFSFESDDRDFKSWLYVKNFELYYFAFNLINQVKDSSINIPQHHLFCWEEINHFLSERPQRIVENYYQRATMILEEYEKWLHSEWVTVMSGSNADEKKIVLIYNKIWGEELSISLYELPIDYVITTDRRYFDQATVVVFHLPDLFKHLTSDLDKKDGQIWVAWYLESEDNYPWMRNPEISEMFDVWMSYRQDADVVYPYYKYEYAKLFTQPFSLNSKLNKTCMFISSPINRSGRQEYLKELMNHTAIDSFGKLYNNQQLTEDNGIETKIKVYQKYKFVIAFENSIDTDYVTEKFFDPLLTGAVPIYYGAPNIEDFAPGAGCFVDVRHFDSPQSLAGFINKCYEDEQLYADFFEWKKKPLRKTFLQKVMNQKNHPFTRLCELVNRVYALPAKIPLY